MPVVLAVAPALPLHKAGPYVAAAYIVFMAVILLYVTIMAVRLTRNQRELRELRRDLERHREREHARQPAGRPALDDDDVQAPLLPHA
jgi:hypothetical protein